VEKHQQNQNSIHFSLALGTFEQDKVDVIYLYCSSLLQILNKVKAKMCKIILKNTSNLELPP
jgi:hypothetical protein